tara:strand:+ start:574 stop:774 length:201 start_codon:yes stop_codon:yes gene_type:complete
VVTTKNITIVKVSNLKLQSAVKFPELIQLNRKIVLFFSEPKYFINKIQDKIEDINKKDEVINWEYL